MTNPQISQICNHSASYTVNSSVPQSKDPSSRNNSSHTCHTTAHNMSTSQWHNQYHIEWLLRSLHCKMRTAIPCETRSSSDIRNCRGRLVTRQCLKHALRTQIVHVVDSATVWTSQRIPYHVNVSFNDVMIIYGSSEQQVMEEYTTHKYASFLLVLSFPISFPISFFFFLMLFMSWALGEEYSLLVKLHHFYWRQDVEKPTFSSVVWPCARKGSEKNGNDSTKIIVVMMYSFHLVWCNSFRIFPFLELADFQQSIQWREFCIYATA